MSEPPNPLVWLAAWLATVGGVWTLFARADSVLRRANKVGIARTLRHTITVGRRLPRHEVVQNWPEVFGEIFDAVFGERHFTWACFFRSSLASSASVVIVGLLYFAVYGDSTLLEEFDRLGGSSIPENLISAALLGSFLAALYSAAFAFCFICINLIPDYLSLLETRQIIRWMSRAKRPEAIAAFLALDIVATAAIALGGLLVLSEVVFALDGGRYLPDTGWQTFRVLLQRQFPFGFVSIFFYSAFFTSVWTWLYAVSLSLLELVPRWLIWIDRLVDIDRKPLEALGLVAAILVSVLFVLAFVVSVI